MSQHSRAHWIAIENRRAQGSALGRAFLTDDAANAEFERMIERLRGEPGRKGGKQ